MLLAGNTSYTPSGPGTYYAEARNSINSCISSSRTAITVTQDNPSTAILDGDKVVFVNQDATFINSSTNADTYQWQVSTDGGISYTDVLDGTEYLGAQSTTLTVIKPEIDKNNYEYRVLASKIGSSCSNVASNSATLTVKVRTVITNRRITHRVKKN